MAMQEIYKLISRLVNTNLNLLILGESGTGKKLIAKSIHDLSSINNKLFWTIVIYIWYYIFVHHKKSM